MLVTGVFSWFPVKDVLFVIFFRYCRSLSFSRPQFIARILGSFATLTYWLVGVNFLHCSHQTGMVFSPLREFLSILENVMLSSGFGVEYSRLQTRRILTLDLSSLHFKQREVQICLVPKSRLISVSSSSFLGAESVDPSASSLDSINWNFSSLTADAISWSLGKFSSYDVSFLGEEFAEQLLSK